MTLAEVQLTFFKKCGSFTVLGPKIGSLGQPYGIQIPQKNWALRAALVEVDHHLILAFPWPTPLALSRRFSLAHKLAGHCRSPSSSAAFSSDRLPFVAGKSPSIYLPFALSFLVSFGLQFSFPPSFSVSCAAVSSSLHDAFRRRLKGKVGFGLLIVWFGFRSFDPGYP